MNGVGSMVTDVRSYPGRLSGGVHRARWPPRCFLQKKSWMMI